jgi:chromosome segregation ATPase
MKADRGRGGSQMKRATLPALLGITLAVVVTAPAAVETPAPADPAARLVQEVGALNRNLERVATLLEEFLAKQEMDMLMKRIEFKSRRLSPLEQDLRNARQERSRREEERSSLRVQLEEMERALEDEETEGAGASHIEWPPGTKVQMETRMTFLRDALDALDLRIMELENDLASRREEIEGWEEFLDREMGLR